MDIYLLALLAVLTCAPRHVVEASLQGAAINNWAGEFGKELHDLGLLITKSQEIKSRYSILNARVEKKHPKHLLAEIVENISRMMDRKMDAINCIRKTAEDAAEVFKYNANETKYNYYNSKYSKFNNKWPKIPAALRKNCGMYLPMELNDDTHFYNLSVNTAHSSVHVPVNIYDRHKEAQIAIQWSEALDHVFKQNYNSDPALSWQYFGSSSGIMRHYPSMHWINKDPDMFDCRTRTWFIEAATCTKDIVILVDSSGSMQGMRKHITKFTVASILDTFSNNDYINVLNYSISFNYTVPCFEDMLVQATKENIETFKEAVNALDPDNKSNVTDAFGEAFTLLERYREIRGCGENASVCNQAIMLVTDGISGNLSNVFDMWNRENNGTTIPVRIFTYLIGAEVTNVNEIMWAACTNRGYYAHVQSLEEVKGSVFKYIPVIARPLVLYGNHPVSWTHAYADLTYDDKKDNVFNEPYRLLISAAVPAFDRKQNQDNETRSATLLGVAATDVPIDEIRKLTLPYKTGIMSYTFVVSNNGYVIMHPSFRPVFQNKILKKNYNSVDFAEIEQHDANLKPRQMHPDVLKLREKLVNGEEGHFPGAKLKYYFDDMRRITRLKYDYYYAPLPNTPFTIGLALPELYGNFTISVSNEIQRNKNMGINLSNFFEGDNWKIHPKWTYCRYHYMEGHEFNTPEEELKHFLKKMYSYEFKWQRQYEGKSTYKHEEYGELEVEDKDEIECGRKVLNDDDYYCDKDLIQRLLFDAKNTLAAYKEPFNFYNSADEKLFSTYNATLRFVATMSGLTRWEYIFGEEENIKKTEFGDLHAKAIDETWYKAAVLEHRWDQDAFVYSVPFDAGTSDDILVTSSYAIFPKDGGMEAAGCVVGYQFSHRKMNDRFIEITSNALPDVTSCDEGNDCYAVDNSGYIVASYNLNNTGRFLGDVERDVMKCLLSMDVFQEVIIYDYQALCETTLSTKSGAMGFLETPLNFILNIASYLISNFVWTIYKTNLYHLWDPNWVYAEDVLLPLSIPTPKVKERKCSDEPEEDEDEEEEEEDLSSNFFACDLKRHLYVLNQSIIKSYFFANNMVSNCTKHFYIRHIPKSNLILLVIIPPDDSEVVSPQSSDTEDDKKKTLTTEPQDVEYLVKYPCQKIELTTLPRRRLAECFSEHPNESEILTCGRSSKMVMGALPISLILMYLLIR